MMKIFSVFGGIGEQKALLEALKLIANAQSAGELLVQILKGSSQLDQLHSLKTQSYEAVVELLNKVTSGAVAPSIIPYMLRLVGLEYNITDMIFVLARSSCRYKIRDSREREYLKMELIENNNLVLKALSLIYKMHTADKIAEVKALRNQVKLIEEEGDEIKERMLNFAYKSKGDFKSFYHITNLAYLSDDVLDRCEDTADTLMNIIVSVAT
ncbi:MAG: hypothetical protein QXF01_01005 [Candidatus Micrarchaeaceae archaeon]